MFTRRTALTASIAACTGALTGESRPMITDVPNKFSSLEELENWAKDCHGGGQCTKFIVRWHGNDVELCYSTRSFTWGRATTEVTFWRPDGLGGWEKTIGTAVMQAEIEVVASLGGCTLNAWDGKTKSWIHWMTVATPMLCNGIAE